MIYTGTIVTKDGNPIPGAQYALINSFHPGEVQGSIYSTGTDGRYSIAIDNNNQFLNVYAPGYQSTVYDLNEVSTGWIILPGQSAIKPWMVLSLVALVVLYLSQGKGKKKVGAIGPDQVKTVLFIAGGVLAFVILKQVLEMLGFWDSKNSKYLNNLSTDPGSFWNPNYWKKETNYSYALTESEAAGYAQQIYNSFGAFNDNEEQAAAVFRAQRTKANVSFIAYVFQNQYGEDLLKFLRGGVWPQDRLSDADVTEISNYVSNLPNY